MSKDAVEPIGLAPDMIAELTAAAEQIVDLRTRITGLTEVKDTLTGRLRELLKVNPDAVYRLGGRTVAITQKTTFDPVTAARVLSPELLALITVTRTEVDEDRARLLLAPAAFDACRIPYGKPAVTVK
jgi:hypothetical protein